MSLIFMKDDLLSIENACLTQSSVPDSIQPIIGRGGSKVIMNDTHPAANCGAARAFRETF
jgi:hypothetical protein